MIHVTKASKTGKLQGIDSINTSSLSNEFCQKMADSHNSICNNCYSNKLSKIYANLDIKLNYNSDLLSSGFISLDKLPKINSLVFRFSSYGELINKTHFINLLNITLINPQTRFVLWTKRKDIVKNGLKNRPLPDNFKLIYSSPVKNKISKLPEYFSKVFTVFDKNQSIDINCGGKKCINCMICYTDNSIVYVNEVIK